MNTWRKCKMEINEELEAAVLTRALRAYEQLSETRVEVSPKAAATNAAVA